MLAKKIFLEVESFWKGAGKKEKKGGRENRQKGKKGEKGEIRKKRERNKMVANFKKCA